MKYIKPAALCAHPSSKSDYRQAVIEAGIIPHLVDILQNSEFKTRKEAAWAISNATSGGSPEQIKLVIQDL